MPFLIQGLIIFLISLYTFYPSFSLGLFGDDWVMLWMYMHYFGPGAPTGVTNHFTYFLSGYGPYEITMGLLYKFFSYNSSIYYLFSYVFRLLAAFAIWPLIFYLTRSRLAAFYAVLFLSITTIGLETTNWVFNMTSYLAITFLSLFMYFFVKSREKLNNRLFALSVICFYLAHIFAPIRMTGLLPFTFILELFLLLRSSKLRLSLLRLSIILIVFIIITTTGAITETRGRLIGGAAGVISAGINTSFTLIQQGQFRFLFNPLITIGRMIVPEAYFSNLPNRENLLLIIGLVITSSSIFLIKNKKNAKLSLAFFIAILWIIFSFLFSWFRDPKALYPIDFRYFIPTAVGFAIFLSAIIGLGKNFTSRLNLFLLALVILILHIMTTRNYFIKEVGNAHGSEAINKMWSSILPITKFGKPDEPVVYYFESAPEKRNLLFYSVEFGLPYRIPFIYKMYSSDAYYKSPSPMDDWKDVVSAVKDGKTLVPRQFPEKPIPIDNVYGFSLTSDNNLVNITTEVRNKLKEELAR